MLHTVIVNKSKLNLEAVDAAACAEVAQHHVIGLAGHRHNIHARLGRRQRMVVHDFEIPELIHHLQL